jgi:hypothetical protein
MLSVYLAILIVIKNEHDHYEDKDKSYSTSNIRRINLLPIDFNLFSIKDHTTVRHQRAHRKCMNIPTLKLINHKE